MLKAVWVKCPGMSDPFAHSMRDNCTSCAPFWEDVPTCPDCGGKLLKTGRAKCQKCKKYITVTGREDSENA